jgi:hypothetical protein
MEIKSREFWGAKPPKKKYARPSKTILGLVVHWSAYKKAETVQDEIKQLQQIQDLHQNTRKWNDAAYNFAVGDSGNIYEIRGYYNRGASQGGNTREETNYNNKNYLSVVWLGGSNNNDYPSEAAVNSVKWLWKQVDGNLLGHNHFKKTTCPGEAWNILIKAKLTAVKEEDIKTIKKEDDFCNWQTGDKGKDIVRIQKLLNSCMDSNLVEDGIYGKKTEKVVIQFQIKYFTGFYEADGQVGAITYAKLLEIAYDKLSKGK